jgi:predicted AAA+ superfamily ATPase
MTHIMENIIFNELQIRECSVDIGIVYGNEKNAKGKITPVAREIDFIAASGGKKTYIQSAYALGTEEKAITENKPFALTGVGHLLVRLWFVRFFGFSGGNIPILRIIRNRLSGQRV